ncbi:hypothetical protein VMCG_08291 [Cytospora schulzeri]|uniref:Uncharacterized protein n=1 Tax=Cytospora schulzeri TaxID=448051 RepID=A0A423VSL9_9PEZI|nr:hypothetical protein VMCG_08291 [Valsa malicola]
MPHPPSLKGKPKYSECEGELKKDNTTTLCNTATLVDITSTSVVSGFNLASSRLFLPLMYRLPVSTSAKMYDRPYHDGMKTVVPLAAVAIASFSFSAHYSSSSSSSSTASLSAQQPS